MDQKMSIIFNIARPANSHNSGFKDSHDFSLVSWPRNKTPNLMFFGGDIFLKRNVTLLNIKQKFCGDASASV